VRLERQPGDRGVAWAHARRTGGEGRGVPLSARPPGPRGVGGLGSHYIKVDPARLKPGSGAWVHPLQIVNRPYAVPATGAYHPTETHELGTLPIGTGDPNSPNFDVRTLVASRGNAIEARLPWALLGRRAQRRSRSAPDERLHLEPVAAGGVERAQEGRFRRPRAHDASALALLTTFKRWTCPREGTGARRSGTSANTRAAEIRLLSRARPRVTLRSKSLPPVCDPSGDCETRATKLAQCRAKIPA
jgi:hypothetical protein